ncbi:DUF817 domain-containing protein [Terricaulis silvestris]|uniref:Putative integral membrane protein n=1 Tax=Terricaulis silvestris TaxID=2686094 RepID=A0A6I6MT70_9CAUL|nr:DUF817 domain-containing protein [Terricaulis silvestris]QGZ94333.1 putative integral membrane protein [Terricaulis silvestris]
MSLKDKIKAQVAVFDAWARPWADKSKLRGWAYEFLLFGLKQAWACLFGGLMLALLVGTHLFWPENAPIARYDFLVLASVAIQGALLATKLERWDEAVVILIFHVVGTIMEIFKTAHGSWIYPEESVLRIGGVPLFSGFMYACVGSYVARAMRLFEIKFVGYPPLWTTWVLALLAYVNFFTHHYIIDIRLGLFAFSALIFWRTWFVFTPDKKPRFMPMLVGLLLVSLFIWFAENLGTFAAAWVYPSQQDGWHVVPIEKMGAWYLLMLLSFVLVTLVHKPEAFERADSSATGETPAVQNGGRRREESA